MAIKPVKDEVPGKWEAIPLTTWLHVSKLRSKIFHTTYTMANTTVKWSLEADYFQACS